MRLAISNIAWDVQEDEAVAYLLQQYGIDAVDIAHSKYFDDPKSATEADILRVRDWWRGKGIEITGMQALLFGTSGLNLFGDAATQQAMLDHFNAVCRIGGILGATRLVFGSPKNRDRSKLSDAETDNISTHFFRRLGDIASAHGVIICLEPNPASYGCNFMTTTDEAARIVQLVAHPAVKLHFDSGAVFMNDESAPDMLKKYAQIIGHVHASEPQLATLGDANCAHDEVAATLSNYLPQHVVSIEMLASKNESHLVAVERALHFATQHYRAENKNGASL